MKMPKIKKLTTKVILMMFIYLIIFCIAALPILKDITFDTLYPFLIDHINLKLGNSAAVMSNFLAYNNLAIRGRTLTTEFQDLARGYADGEYSDSEFAGLISEQLALLESTTAVNERSAIDITSYPAVYVEGKEVVCDEAVRGAAEQLVASDWFKNYAANGAAGRTYAPVFEAAGGKLYFTYVFSNASLQIDVQDGERVNYYVFVLSDYNDVKKLCKDVTDLHIEDYTFIGINNEVIYQNYPDSQMDYARIQSHDIFSRQHYVIQFAEGDDLYYSVLVSSEGESLRLVLHATRQNLQRMYDDNVDHIILMFTLLVIIFVVIVIRMINRILGRLTTLAKKMKVVQSGNYDVKVEDDNDDEIGQLAGVFNNMTEQIKDNVNCLIEKENKERVLQYNLMVSAIDPHFVYNTLNTLTRLVEMGRTQEVIEVNDALINFMKDNLKMKSLQAFDTVENERNMLREYVKIQNYLCDNTIKLEFEVSDENLKLEIPKFLLQPLIENSIIHGIILNIDSDGNPIGGVIRVVVKTKEDRVKISVWDNGVGMSQETIDKNFPDNEKVVFEGNTHFDHIGLVNIRTRLSFLFDDDFTLKARSEKGEGTIVIIEFPKYTGGDGGSVTK